MKRILCMLIALTVILATLCIFSSCNKPVGEGSASTQKPTQTEAPTEAPTEKPSETTSAGIQEIAPEGYQWYSDGVVRFAYPQKWQKHNDNNMVILVNENGYGNNISIVSEAKTDIYDTLTVEAFMAEMKPYFESMGLTVYGATIERMTNRNGIKLTMIRFAAQSGETVTTQTQYVCHTNEKTYSLTVTEATPQPDLFATVFTTLDVIENKQ